MSKREREMLRVIRRFLVLAKSDAWNGSFKLADLLEDARALVAEDRESGRAFVARSVLGS